MLSLTLAKIWDPQIGSCCNWLWLLVNTHKNGHGLNSLMKILDPPMIRYCAYINKHNKTVKSSRDITCTLLSLTYYGYPCLHTFLYCHPYFYHQFYSIAFFACCPFFATLGKYNMHCLRHTNTAINLVYYVPVSATTCTCIIIMMMYQWSQSNTI